ncbi:porin [Vibrio sp. SA48]|uniref:porin n=1 Tax=Vibrio TaxID=662 RepID=UPI0015935E96|nr:MULTISPECIES: porin [Vibrio]MBD1565473.1 porin [Vibrio sp. S12_S33]MDE1311419.1 porin [Vibrio aestuarianus]NGZ17675.1 porin [Vibrio aestuarianus]NGZ92878.1 porin [Vibrio aestuarianus subsp. cardii]
MKKTLLALAVMAAAGSAQAGIEVYNNEGVTVNLKGDIEVVYVQAIAENSEFKQEIQDADFGFDVRYAINDDLQFGGYWEFDGASSDVTKGTSKTANVGDAYVALYSQSMGSIKVGRTCGALDDAGVGSDYQFGADSFFSNGSSFCSDEMIRYDLDKGMFYGTIAYAQDKNENLKAEVNGVKDVLAIGKDGSYIDAKLGLRVADFDFTVSYGDADAAAIKADESLLALEARYAGIENTNLAVAYYTIDGDMANPGTDVKRDNIYLTADYTFEKWLFAVGYNMASTDVVNSKDVDTWFVNAGYALAPNTTAYVEVGGNDADNTDTGVALGVKASF